MIHLCDTCKLPIRSYGRLVSLLFHECVCYYDLTLLKLYFLYRFRANMCFVSNAQKRPIKIAQGIWMTFG